jgi:predicted amidophosphoribosyltransferase
VRTENPNTPSLWSILLDLVAAKECGGCGRPPLRKSALCGPCTQALTAAGTARRAVLDARAAPRTFAAAYYEDPVRTMLIHYKERARADLGRVLGVALAGAVVPSLAEVRGPLLLVPMPSARSAVRQRGADTTAQLARHAAQALRAAGLPARSVPALRQARRVADQAGLDRAERAANLAGALRPAGRRARDLDGADVVLVDDIATTGATLAEGARAARAGGARVVGAATVAAARLRR